MQAGARSSLAVGGCIVGPPSQFSSLHSKCNEVSDRVPKCTEPVKPTRRYDSPRRREQAEATRRDILAAAQRLLRAHGYAATTMAAIAAEAGVALKTVYVAFETKSGLLRALWHLLLRGDEEDVPIAERRWYREVLEEPDPERQLRLDRRNSRVVKERDRGAARGDPRRGAQPIPTSPRCGPGSRPSSTPTSAVIVESMRGAGRAAPRASTSTRATDILWTLNHPDLWQLLVGERGWTPERWEQWSADLACAQLLGRREA